MCLPLIKGHSLDKTLPCNYRPISNLNFISKVLERLFLSRFQPHIFASSNFNKYQSTYRPGCSTETALQLLLDRIYGTADEGRPTLLISLDMSAAFDTIDHTVLLKRLSRSFGVAGNVHSWIHSYLTGRTQSLHWFTFIPSQLVLYWCPSRVCPQPITFFYIHFTHLYHCSLTQSLSAAIHRRHATVCGIVALSPVNYNHDISALQSCLTSLQAWFCESGMASTHLSQSPFSLAHHKGLNLCLILNASLANTTIPLSDKVKILDVTIDSNLTIKGII